MEMIEQIINHGIMVVLSGLFLWQWVRSINRNEEREEKLYDTINSLSKQIPEIKNDVAEIKAGVDHLTSVAERK